MKWFWRGLWALVIAFIGGSVPLYFEEDIRAFRAYGVRAELMVGPWFPHPDTKAASEADIGSLMYNLQRTVDEILPVARLTIDNEGRQTVENIRLDFSEFKFIDAVIALPNGTALDAVTHRDDKPILLPPLKPGEHHVLFIFTSLPLNNSYYVDDLRIFSSAGQLPIKLKYYDDVLVVSDKVGTILGWFLVAIAVGFTSLLGLGIAFYADYVKRLMKSEDYYLTERTRYDADPKKFSPGAAEKARQE